MSKAQKVQVEISRTIEQKEVKGFMALRNNVYDSKLELWHLLTPLEYYLVDVIIDKTIKFRKEESKMTIKELMERTRQDHTKIYRVLKSLETKKVITRKKNNHDLIIGLNKDYFGALLITKHQEALTRRKSLKLVCQSSTYAVPEKHMNSANLAPSLCQSGTPNKNQQFVIIKENSLLKTTLKENSLNKDLKDSKTEIGESSSLKDRNRNRERGIDEENRDEDGNSLDPVVRESERLIAIEAKRNYSMTMQKFLN